MQSLAPGELALGETPIRVMVVDDSAIMRGLLTHWLEKEPGVEVVARHANGKTAAEDVQQSAPDIVLLDIEMPVMDGIEALPLLLKARPETRVLMVSTLTKRERRDQLQGAFARRHRLCSEARHESRNHHVRGFPRRGGAQGQGAGAQAGCTRPGLRSRPALCGRGVPQALLLAGAAPRDRDRKLDRRPASPRPPAQGAFRLVLPRAGVGGAAYAARCSRRSLPTGSRVRRGARRGKGATARP